MPHAPGGTDRGFGLIVVVVALAILGGLTLGAFGAARQELGNAVYGGFAAQAFEAAEAGLAAAGSVAAASAGAAPMVPRSGPEMASARIRYRTTIVRLNETLLFLTAVGERRDGGGEVLARRVLGVVGKLLPESGGAPARFEPLQARGWMQLYY